jgi:hypothetical protein
MYLLNIIFASNIIKIHQVLMFLRMFNLLFPQYMLTISTYSKVLLPWIIKKVGIHYLQHISSTFATILGDCKL